MANRCYINMTIETETVAEAEALSDELGDIIACAVTNDDGAFLGSYTRYLFWPSCDQEKYKVFIDGYVDWGYRDSEFVEMFKWLQSKVSIKRFRMQYQELVGMHYGVYKLRRDGQIEKSFLRGKDFPNKSDYDNFAVYIRMIKRVFRKKKVTKTIPID